MATVKLRDIFPTAYFTMDRYGESVVNEMKTRLINAGKKATGDLIKSLDWDIEIDEDAFLLEFDMLDYGVYVDEGRKPGKFPPINAIMKWVKVKKIGNFFYGKGSKKKKELDQKQIAFVIARSIAKNGIPPTRFYTLSTTRRVDKFEADFQKALEKDVETYFNK